MHGQQNIKIHIEGFLKKHVMNLIRTDQHRVQCQVPMIR